MIKEAHEIVYRLRLKAAPDRVFAFLATDQGRGKFWAERTEQQEQHVVFHFSDGQELSSQVLESSPSHHFSLTYFNGSIVTFDIHEEPDGTILQLRETNLSDSDERQNRAGWVSVLLNLKAQADYEIDLRNHHPQYTWSEGYVDN
jgi:uncharacterized protein YndB with AHSA1/START domain